MIISFHFPTTSKVGIDMGKDLKEIFDNIYKTSVKIYVMNILNISFNFSDGHYYIYPLKKVY